MIGNVSAMQQLEIVADMFWSGMFCGALGIALGWILRHKRCYKSCLLEKVK